MDFRKPASRILFIGHRGFPALAPENTLPSFERALDAGCDAIECDVRITKDGHFVVGQRTRRNASREKLRA